jgi:oxygen-independent coproporphyrinogen-3 oxidase
VNDPRVEYLRTEDGVRVAVHRLGDPHGPPLLLVPGTFSNSTFWLGTRGTGLARTLAGEGYDVWVLDPRGHGQSDRPLSHHRWDFDDWARADVPVALRAASERRRCAIIGHSAGGAAILAALAADASLRDRVSGAVILATPVPWLQGWRKIASRAFRRWSLVLGRFPARRLGLGPEDELPHVMAQWMTWNLQANWRGDDGTDYFGGIAHLEMPILTMAGSGDTRFAPPEACRALFDMIGSRDKTFVLCGKATGYSEDFTHPGLVVSRAAQAEIWPRISAWLAFLSEPGTGCAVGPVWRQ